MEGVMEGDIISYIVFVWLLVIFVGYVLLLQCIEPVKEPEGSVLLINFYECKTKTGFLKTRNKPDKDVQAIKEFCQENNYLPIEILCTTKNEVIAAIVKYGNDPQRVLESCSMIFLGSHGNDGYIVDKKWNEIYIQDIVNKISKLPYLRQNNTLLIIQACRGEKELTSKDFIEDTHELKRPGKAKKPIVMPHTLSKFCIMHSTQPGTKSKQGYFVPRLFKLLSKYANEKDVLTILDNVLHEMPRHTLHGGQIQVAELQYNNKETFFLCPKATEVKKQEKSVTNLSVALFCLPFVILKESAQRQ